MLELVIGILSDMTQIIYGIPRSRGFKIIPHQFERIFVATQNPNPELKGVLDLANQKQVPVTWTSREDLARLTKGGFHQNVAGLLHELSYADLDDVLGSPEKRGNDRPPPYSRRHSRSQNFGSLIGRLLDLDLTGW